MGLLAYRPVTLSIKIDGSNYTTSVASIHDYWRTVVRQDADVLSAVPADGKSQARDDMRRAHDIVLRLHLKTGLLTRVMGVVQ